MAKLIVLALTFTAFVAFTSAHRTIVTTTIEEHDEECSQRLQGQRLHQCQTYLQQQQEQSSYEDNKSGQHQESLRQECCAELQNIYEQCQCEAVKQVFREAQQLQHEQQVGSIYGSQLIQRLKQKAQNLPNKCNLQTKQCKLGIITTTTTTTTNVCAATGVHSSDSHPQQCRQDVKEQNFNQCQRYIAQQSGSSRTLLMSINGQEQEEQLKECCNEVQNVRKECQCEAMIEVYNQATQQQGSQQQRGGQHQHTEEQMRQIVVNLPNKCNVDVEQCQIPSRML